MEYPAHLTEVIQAGIVSACLDAIKHVPVDRVVINSVAIGRNAIVFLRVLQAVVAGVVAKRERESLNQQSTHPPYPPLV